MCARTCAYLKEATRVLRGLRQLHLLTIGVKIVRHGSCWLTSTSILFNDLIIDSLGKPKLIVNH